MRSWTCLSWSLISRCRHGREPTLCNPQLASDRGRDTRNALGPHQIGLLQKNFKSVSASHVISTQVCFEDLFVDNSLPPGSTRMGHLDAISREFGTFVLPSNLNTLKPYFLCDRIQVASGTRAKRTAFKTCEHQTARCRAQRGCSQVQHVLEKPSTAFVHTGAIEFAKGGSQDHRWARSWFRAMPNIQHNCINTESIVRLHSRRESIVHSRSQDRKYCKLAFWVKTTARSIPVWSPTTVLTAPSPA